MTIFHAKVLAQKPKCQCSMEHKSRMLKTVKNKLADSRTLKSVPGIQYVLSKCFERILTSFWTSRMMKSISPSLHWLHILHTFYKHFNHCHGICNHLYAGDSPVWNSSLTSRYLYPRVYWLCPLGYPSSTRKSIFQMKLFISIPKYTLSPVFS